MARGSRGQKAYDSKMQIVRLRPLDLTKTNKRLQNHYFKKKKHNFTYIL